MSWARITRKKIDGRPVIVKATDYDARLEADGLRALAAAGAPAPEVIEADENRLVMTEVDGPPDWPALGEALAVCHGSTSADFGYHHDNYLGPLVQPNPWTGSWATFYADHRLGPHLDTLRSDLRQRIERAIQSGRLEALLEHGQEPSLVHGDLWSGNIVEGRWLIDPAVNYADRELDLAFAAVFGDLPAAMRQAYVDTWPLDAGWEERRPALQLYHLLVHVRIFGGGYVGMVEGRLDDLGW